jgi:hypothetical protein
MEIVRTVAVGIQTLIRGGIVVADGAVYSIVEDLKNTYFEKYLNIDYLSEKSPIYIIIYLQNKTVID